MSDNAKIADNQQGSPRDPPETTRRAPLPKNIIKAYFLGALHDGTFSCNERFRIAQKGTAWLKFLQELLNEIGYRGWIYKEGKNRDIYVLETLANFLDLAFDPMALDSIGEKIAYVRGFFDAEGGIPHKKGDRFYIQLTQSDELKLQKLKAILQELGIATGKVHNPSYRVDPSYWRMYVLAASCRLFVERVGSWHPKKVAILRKRTMI